MKEYKIDESKMDDFMSRIEGNGYKYLILITICLPFILFYFLRQQELENDLVWGLIVCFTFPFLIAALSIPLANKFQRLWMQNISIIIDDKSITRKINSDFDYEFFWFLKTTLSKTRRSCFFHNLRIEFKDLLSYEFIKGNLIIKGKKNNSFTGKNIIMIPQEFDGINEIERIVEEKINHM